MSIEKVSWEVFALFGLKGTETISNALIFVYDLDKKCKLFSKMPKIWNSQQENPYQITFFSGNVYFEDGHFSK